MDLDFKKIFSSNLNFFLEYNKKNQIDLCNDLSLSKSVVSSWCTGTRLPRMDKVQMLADYFNINKSDLLEKHNYDVFKKTSNKQDVLIEEEQILLNNFNQLNDEGKERLLNYSDDLVSSKKYIQSDTLRLDKKVG